MTRAIDRSQFGDLRAFLVQRGYRFETRPHQEFLARSDGVVVSLYSTGKVVVSGSSLEARDEVERFVAALANGAPAESELSDKGAPLAPTGGFTGTRVGMDEAGKGDFFGPLVAGAVLVSEYQAENLRDLGVKDSKQLSDRAVRELARSMKASVLFPEQCRTVNIPPSRYNILYHKMGNLNRILGWAHARALEKVLRFKEPCSLAIADQFGNPKYIEDALFSRGRRIRLVQMPKGERDVAVAAASILARNDFLASMEQLGRHYRVAFPLGASQVEEFARRFVAEHGPEVLLETAKVHFATTARVTSAVEALHDAIRTKALAERVE